MSGDRLVWDSDRGSTRSRGKLHRPEPAPPRGDGIVRIRRETGGRGGKTATTIHGVAGTAAQLGELANELRKLCGVGGTVKGFVIELQGDQRDRVEAFLIERGHTVKRAGG